MSRFSRGSLEADAKDSNETYEVLGFMDLTPSNNGINANNEASGNDTTIEHLVC